MQRSPAPLMQVNCSGNGQRLARQPACATGASIKHRSSRCSRVPAAPCSSACSLAETRLGAPSRRFPRDCSGQCAEWPSRRCGSRYPRSPVAAQDDFGQIIESTSSRPRRYYLVRITDAGSVPCSTTIHPSKGVQ